MQHDLLVRLKRFVKRFVKRFGRVRLSLERCRAGLTSSRYATFSSCACLNSSARFARSSSALSSSASTSAAWARARASHDKGVTRQGCERQRAREPRLGCERQRAREPRLGCERPSGRKGLVEGPGRVKG
eukprot:3179778-Prymnesium_polylepis.1